MRFLHTSDWHLGQRLCDRDRIEEHCLFFDWLKDALDEHDVDFLLVTGDVFDSSVPSNQSLSAYYRLLSESFTRGLKGALIIAGNHDSPAALSAPRTLLESLNIHVRGAKSDDPTSDIVILEGRSGEKIACALVPYMRERDLRHSRAGETVAERDRGILEGIQSHYSRINDSLAACKADANLVTGHLFAAGQTTGDGERDLYVGNLGQVGLDIFPALADYVALGHIHVPGELSPGIRYSGSALPMDFGETRPKSVCLVDLPGKTTVLSVPCFRPLVSLHGDRDTIELQAAVFSPPENEYGLKPWVDVLIEDAIPDPVFFRSIEEELSQKGAELLRIRIDHPANADVITATAGNLEDISPRTMFELRCKSRDVEPDEALLLAFDELIETVNSADREQTDED